MVTIEGMEVIVFTQTFQQRSAVPIITHLARGKNE